MRLTCLTSIHVHASSATLIDMRTHDQDAASAPQVLGAARERASP
jgi:hypothetical protein